MSCPYVSRFSTIASDTSSNWSGFIARNRRLAISRVNSISADCSRRSQRPSMAEPADCSQSEEIRVDVVANDRGGAVWRACLGGCCVQSGSGVGLVALLEALLISRGIRPPGG
jgi:hypothetical protein